MSPNHQLILDIMGVGVLSETKYKIYNFYIGMQLYWRAMYINSLLVFIAIYMRVMIYRWWVY